jgi:hypothetical protein
MIGTRFQNTSQIRQHIVLFALAFRNVVIERRGETLRVPISFANKERFFGRLESEIDGRNPKNKAAAIETVLPRMSFNITNMQYRSDYKTPSTNSKSFEQPDGTFTAQFVPSPWEIDMELSVYTRYEEDMLTIMEQIVPFFQPHITLQMETELEYPSIKHRDVHITLNGITPQEELFGSMEERRVLVWNFGFKLSPVYLYPPSLNTGGRIEKILIDFATGTETIDVEEYDEVERDVLSHLKDEDDA